QRIGEIPLTLVQNPVAVGVKTTKERLEILDDRDKVLAFGRTEPVVRVDSFSSRYFERSFELGLLLGGQRREVFQKARRVPEKDFRATEELLAVASGFEGQVIVFLHRPRLALAFEVFVNPVRKKLRRPNVSEKLGSFVQADHRI